MGWKGKLIGGFFGGAIGATVGDALQNTQEEKRKENFSKIQNTRNIPAGSGNVSVYNRILSSNLGIKTNDDKFIQICKQGKQCPHKFSQTFHIDEKQFTFEIKVYQYYLDEDNHQLVGVYRITGFTPTKKQYPIEILFEIKRKGDLIVNAKDGITKRKLQVIRGF